MAIFKPPQPDLLPASASAPSTYPAPGGHPSTTQLPSLSNSSRDCNYRHDACGDRTMQEDVALSTSTSGSALPAAVRRPADCRTTAFPRPTAAPTQQTDEY
ncbi:hypothetical protein MSAN_01510300 [Mycena sanguinolenta]|uniref:Uncharacterized protein n=1 Tax=Mycena sanguinolenta TaxID=230812 RepID=A0A8H6Y7W7_9AGAR|nr:hypothetical protein MSAN_01510300 [Mycena sanguinolenta]